MDIGMNVVNFQVDQTPRDTEEHKITTFIFPT